MIYRCDVVFVVIDEWIYVIEGGSDMVENYEFVLLVGVMIWLVDEVMFGDLSF